MLLRIVRTGPGCVYQPGQTVQMDDNTARSWIMRGFAVETDQPPPDAPVSTHMDPPRFICGCGFVARSAAGLKKHQRSC